MGNRKEQGNVPTLDVERVREVLYGDAWKVQGILISFLQLDHLNAIVTAGYYHPWYMILTKLIRLLYSPRNLDSWKDIIGYANLVVKELEAKPKELRPRSKKGRKSS